MQTVRLRKCIYENETYYFHKTGIFTVKDIELNKLFTTTKAMIENVFTGVCKTVEFNDIIFIK